MQEAFKCICSLDSTVIEEIDGQKSRVSTAAIDQPRTPHSFIVHDTYTREVHTYKPTTHKRWI